MLKKAGTEAPAIVFLSFLDYRDPSITLLLERAQDQASVVKAAETEFTPTIVTFTLLSMKGWIWEDSDFLLDWHQEAIINLHIQTNN